MFNAYIVPSKGMSSGASLVTGLQVTNSELFLHDKRLDTVPPSMAFHKFLFFLRSQMGSVILVAHNGFRYISKPGSKRFRTIIYLCARYFCTIEIRQFISQWLLLIRFDAPLLNCHLKKFDLLDEFQCVVKGFSDTLEIFREKLPDRKKEKKKFSQEAFALDFFGDNSVNGVHNAVNDVLLLGKLLTTICDLRYTAIRDASCEMRHE